MSDVIGPGTYHESTTIQDSKSVVRFHPEPGPPGSKRKPMGVNPEIPKSIGRYEILSLVGRGGMGVLYRARDPRLERDVALKMMLVDFRSDPNALDRFQREAKAVARLQHRNVVTIHELGDVDSTPYIVMELLGGGDLDAILRRPKAMPLSEKLDVAIQLCEGLNYAHGQGIVHRDIKPSNIRVLEDGSVKILDFGIARFVNNTLTQSGTIMGTPSYMAPEQILGQPLDGRADLFSVGVLLYELLAGKKPFHGESPTAVAYQIVNVEPPPLRAAAPALPEALSDVVKHALCKRAEDRYQRASELASDLRMIRTALDSALSAASVSADQAGTAKITLGPLHATSGLAKESKIFDVRIRETGEREKSGRLRAAGGKSPVLVVAILAVLAIAGVGGWYAWNQGLIGPGANPQTQTRGAAQASVAPPVTVPPPPDGPQELAVSSNPAGAKILVNGVDTGKVTPATVAFVDGRALELSLAGFQSLKVAISDDEIKAGKKEFKLAREPRPVQLTVEWTAEFEVVQGSKILSASATDHQLKIPPGGEPVIARNKELLLNYPIPLDFQKSQATIRIPEPGTITVYSTDSTCGVTVDRQSVGFPPITKKRIAAGKHTVNIVCSDGRQEARPITVEPGADAEAVRFRLSR